MPDREEQYVVTYAVQLPDGSFAKESPRHQYPLMWADQILAENYMAQLAAAAASIGITTWTGRVMQQLSTPFVPVNGETTAHMLDQLEAWMKEQG